MPYRADNRLIIVKRRRPTTNTPHHSGAWKIAYADFITAMMAFFLLMWLLNATTEDQRKGLADYFNPSVPISRVSAGGAGMLEGESLFDKSRAAGSVPEGVQPRPSHREDGPPLGREDAAKRAVEAAPDATLGGDSAEESATEAAAAQPGDRLADRAEMEDRGAMDDRAATDDRAAMKDMARRIEEATRGSGELSRHFFLHVTPEGLVIEIIDANDRPLFPAASARPAPILARLVDVLVPVLDEVTNDIAVVGHTDSVPFGGDGYTNWELSADRANAARRLMLRRGLPESRIARVTGKAAVEPLVADSTAPQNRRIAITLLREDGAAPR